MSSFKKKLINILYNSKICLDSKKYSNHKQNIIEMNGLNNKIYKKGNLSNHNIKNYNLLTNFDKENNLNVTNITTVPSCHTNKSSEKLKISKISKAKHNKTFININFDNKKQFLIKRKANVSNDLQNFIKTRKKNKINGIPNCSNSNINFVEKKFEYNRSCVNVKENKKNKLFLNFNLSQIKKLKLNKNLIKNNINLNRKKISLNYLPSIKPIYTNYNNISKNISKDDIKKKEHSKSNNKIKDKIIQMEKEFSSEELKKNLINRPKRTLNSKLFQFKSKDFNCFSPTLHFINNSKSKQYFEKKNIKIYNSFSERYINDVKTKFNKKYTNLNEIHKNNSLSRSRKTNISDINDINNKLIRKDNLFNTRIKLNNTKENNNDLYKEILKYKNFYQLLVITREYQKCSNYIRNGKKRYLKDDFLTSFTNNNLEYSSRTNQLSF